MEKEVRGELWCSRIGAPGGVSMASGRLCDNDNDGATVIYGWAVWMSLALLAGSYMLLMLSSVLFLLL